MPFAIIGHSYIRIWQFLNHRRRKSRRSLMISDRESEYETQRKKRLLRMLVTMVVLFVICWLPFNLLYAIKMGNKCIIIKNFRNILRDMKKDSFLKPYFSFFFLLAHLISMTTTACNPILYAWMNHGFRNEFVRVVPICNFFIKKNTTDATNDEKSIRNLSPRSSLASNAGPKTRIITDCEPALNRRNCNDSVIIKTKYLKKKLEQVALLPLTNNLVDDNKSSVTKNETLNLETNSNSPKNESALIFPQSDLIICNHVNKTFFDKSNNLRRHFSAQKNSSLASNIFSQDNETFNNYEINDCNNALKTNQKVKNSQQNNIVKEKANMNSLCHKNRMQIEKKKSNEFVAIRLWRLTRNLLKPINVK